MAVFTIWTRNAIILTVLRVEEDRTAHYTLAVGALMVHWAKLAVRRTT